LGELVSELLGISTYLWIPIIGPFTGGPIGAIVHDLGIGDTLLARGEEPAADLEERSTTRHTSAASGSGRAATCPRLPRPERLRSAR
jgi:glycerol uptake facilitator protein